MNDINTIAYAIGYYDGRAIGIENPPNDDDDIIRVSYIMGYERGVADYCQFELEQGDSNEELEA